MNGDKHLTDKLHEREVERSNVTLNTFLGASRQRPWMLKGGTPVRPTPRSSQAVTALSLASGSPSLPSPAFNNITTRSASLSRKTLSTPTVAESEGYLPNKNKVTEDKSITPTDVVDSANSGDINFSQSLPNLNLVSSKPHSPRVIKPITLKPVSRSSTDLSTELQRKLSKESDTELSTTLVKEADIGTPKKSNTALPIVSAIKPAPESHKESIIKLPQQSKAILPTETGLEKATQLHVGPVAELRVEPIEELSINVCDNPLELDPESERIAQNSPPLPLVPCEPTGRSQPQIHADNRETLDSSGHLKIDQIVGINTVHQSKSSMFTQTLNNGSNNCSNSVPQKAMPSSNSSNNNSPITQTQIDVSADEIPITAGSSTASPSQSSNFTLKSKLTMIEAQLKSVGGLESLNTGLERPRFQLLIEACRVEDFFYVILHQVYILWDFRREEVLSIPGASNIDSLQSGFRIVARIIHENNQLAPSHKRWFAEFPHSLTKLLQTSNYCRKTCINVLNCVLKLAANWYLLMYDCKTRLTPLLAEELVSKLGVFSPIFQRILFTSSRRSLGIRDEGTILAMDQVFKVDQAEYQNSVAQTGDTSLIPSQERQERNKNILQSYSNLIAQFRGSNTRSISNPKISSPQPINNSTTNVLTPNGRTPSIMEIPRSQGNPRVSQVSTTTIPNILDSNIQHLHQYQQKTRVQKGVVNLLNNNIGLEASGYHEQTRPQQNFVQQSQVPINSPYQISAQLTGLNSNGNSFRQQNDSRQHLYSGTPSQGTVLYQNGGLPQSRSTVRQNGPLQMPPVSAGYLQNLGLQAQSQQYQYPPGSHYPQQFHQMQQYPSFSPQQQQQQQQLYQYRPAHAHAQNQPINHNQAQTQSQIQTIQRQQQLHLNHNRLVNQQAIIPNRANQRRSLPSEGQPLPQARNARGSVISNEAQQDRNTLRSNSISSNGSQITNTHSHVIPQMSPVSMQTTSIEQPFLNKVKDDIILYGQTGILNRIIVPPLNWVHPPGMLGINRPELNALHQATLRSPYLVPAALSPPLEKMCLISNIIKL